MSRETEKLLKELDAFMAAHADDDLDEDAVDELIRQFMDQHGIPSPEDERELPPETADDYLELAEDTPTKKKKLEYVRKALELEPDNLDAAVLEAQLTVKGSHALLGALEELAKKEEWRLKGEGLFEPDSMGEFWLIFETRPYMQLLHLRMVTLTECGMMSRAAQECRRMLELCENDNLGVRYDLMHLYAFLEREASALDIEKRYPEETSQMLLPLSILYYKLGQETKAKKYLNQLAKRNKDAKKFVNAVCKDDLDRYIMEMSPYGYRPFHIDELIYEYGAYDFLFDSVPEYFPWAKEALKGRKKNS